MKELTEIKFEEMTAEQKVGFVMIGGSWRPILKDPDDLEFVLGLIKKRALGAVWVSCHAEENGDYAKVTRIIREAADYPILIFTDEESGIGDYMIGQPIALGYIDDEKTAYAYGKAIGIKSHECGFNVVCNPLLDRGRTLRSLHPDKIRASKLAEAMCRGMHDGGVMTCAKHYPSAKKDKAVDTHMAESHSSLTKEELLEDSLYPYRYLNDLGLLDAVMVGHNKVITIDKEYPASASKNLIDVLRKDVGFDGLALTDSLAMLGINARYGEKAPKWMCIKAGIDLSLGFSEKTKFTYDAIMEAYENGSLSKERVDSAVKKVLEFQHKAYEYMKSPKYTSLTEEEDRLARDINKNSIAAVCDEGVSPAISRDGRHMFVFLTDREKDLTVENDTMSVSWYKPELLAKKVRELFPNSGVAQILEYPTPQDVATICKKRVEYDDVVFVSYFNNVPYGGKEGLTPRIISLIEAWEASGLICAYVHFGSPYLIQDLPHLPRIINACKSTACSLYVMDMLAGNLESHGKIPFDLDLH